MEEAILALEKGAMERWRKGDPWGWTDISAEDVTYVDPFLSRPIVGMEQYKAYLKTLEGKVHYQRSEFIEPEIVVVGDAAVLSYNYRSSDLTPEGAILRQTLWNTTEVYFRRDAQWRIVHTHWSYVLQKRPERVEVPILVAHPPQPHEGVLGEVMALESAAMERWRKGDPSGFLEICASEVTYFDTATSKRLNGRDALKSLYAEREGKISYEVMDFLEPNVHHCGDMAALSYRFLSTGLHPNGSVSERTPWNCTEVFVRVDGQWRIVHTHWSYIKGERI